ncbi:hypothetical protein Tco_0070851 [Tanacetum coccineum]
MERVKTPRTKNCLQDDMAICDKRIGLVMRHPWQLKNPNLRSLVLKPSIARWESVKLERIDDLLMVDENNTWKDSTWWMMLRKSQECDAGRYLKDDYRVHYGVGQRFGTTRELQDLSNIYCAAEDLIELSTRRESSKLKDRRKASRPMSISAHDRHKNELMAKHWVRDEIVNAIKAKNRRLETDEGFEQGWNENLKVIEYGTLISSRIGYWMPRGVALPRSYHLESEVLRDNELLCEKLESRSSRQDEVEFLGHKIKDGGLMMDGAKIKAIQEWESPTKVTELRSFLGY